LCSLKWFSNPPSPSNTNLKLCCNLLRPIFVLTLSLVYVFKVGNNCGQCKHNRRFTTHSRLSIYLNTIFDHPNWSRTRMQTRHFWQLLNSNLFCLIAENAFLTNVWNKILTYISESVVALTNNYSKYSKWKPPMPLLFCTRLTVLFIVRSVLEYKRFLVRILWCLPNSWHFPNLTNLECARKIDWKQSIGV
jgi:hypothetical protein